MRLQIDALNWEKEYVKNRLAGVRAAIKANPTENRAANDLEAEACERLLDQIVSSLRHIETEHNSGRTIGVSRDVSARCRGVRARWCAA